MGMDFRDCLGMGLRTIESKVGVEDIYIHSKLKRDIDGVIKNIKEPEVFGSEMGFRGVLFSGYQGTGKTLTAQYIAKAANAVLVDGSAATNGDSINALYKAVRELVKKGKPAIIFLDEIDRFSSREDVVDPNQAATLNTLLMQMDGMESNERITVVGATNRPDRIDIALRRPKRFGKELQFMPPDKDGRLMILRIHAYQKDHKFKLEEKDLGELADRSYGYTGADLVGVLNEAFTNAHLDGRVDVNMEDLEHGLKKVKPSALRDMPFKEPKFKLDNLGGYGLHKQLLRTIKKNSEQALIMLYGPEGTGKTVFAEAFAGEFGYNLIVVAGSAPEDKFVGETGKKIDRYIERAKALAPCVLVFDEIDSLVERQGTMSWKGSWTGLLQSRLSEPIEGVYVFGTVNKPDRLNPIFLSRFTHKLYFGLPSAEDQAEIWVSKGVESGAEIVEGGREGVTCRNIDHAVRLVNHYGLKPSVETFRKLMQREGVGIQDMPRYEEMRKKYGDSVSDFKDVMKIAGE